MNFETLTKGHNYNVLSLDLSYTSTGISWLKNGGLVSGNIYLKEEVEDVGDGMFEARMRHRLKEILTSELEGTSWSAIVVEDVFFGINPKTYRQLLSLNTVIDEMILDGVLETDSLVRIQSGVWKSWLQALISDFKRGMWKDKVFVQYALSSVGVHESGKGYQDRLDAIGMVLGWVTHQLQSEEGASLSVTEKPIKWADVDYLYTEEDDTFGDNSFVKANIDRPDKKKILAFLNNQDPEELHKTFEIPGPISLGLMGAQLGSPVYPAGGYFRFWLKERYFEE